MVCLCFFLRRDIGREGSQLLAALQIRASMRKGHKVLIVLTEAIM